MAIRIAGKVDKSLKTSCKDAEKAVTGIGGAAKKAAKIAAAALLAVAVAVTSFTAASLNTYADYEQSMAKTAAIAQATEQEYAMLGQAAREAGATTTKTAKEAADALGYMALAGWSVQDSVDGLLPVLRLSEATEMDLARASDLVTDSMSALGLGVEQLEDYLNLAVQTNNSANTSAEELMEAYIGCGGAAKTAGADLGDLSVALGILANNGTKGAEAGTAMNAMIVRMTSKDTAIKAMQELGVSAFDTSGQFIGLENVLTDLSHAMGSMTDAEKAHYLSQIAGTNYYSEMSYLLDAVTDGVDGTASAWSNLSGELAKASEGDGALAEMAARVTDTLKGSTEIFKSAIYELQLSVGEAAAPYVKEALDWLSGTVIPNLTVKIQELIPKVEQLAKKGFEKLQKIAAKVSPILQKVSSWISKLGAFASKHKDTILALAAGFGAFVTTLFVVINTMKAVSAVMNGAKTVFGLLSSPIGQIAVVIGLVVAAGILLYQNWDTIKEKAQALWGKVTEVWTNIKTSVTESISAMVTAFQEKFPLMSSFITGWWESIKLAVENVKAVFTNIIDFVQNVFAGNWEAAWDNIVNIFGNLFGMIVNLAKAPINGVISAINHVLSKINSISITIPDWVPGVGGNTLGFSIPTIPALETGGIATAATLAIVGEGNEPEAILPLSKLAELLDKPSPKPTGGGAPTPEGDTFVFAPEQHFHGPVSKKDIEDANRASFEEFKAMYRRMKKEESRKSFA